MSSHIPAAPSPHAATVDRFAAQVPATGAVLHRCASPAEARRTVAGILSELATTPERGVAFSDGAASLLPEGVTPVAAGELRPYLDAAVSTAGLGVAETGSLLLAPRSRWERLIGVVARVHVIAVAERDVRESLDDLPAALQESDVPYLSLVTGPTRTADIERVITVGAHGPAVLHVLLVAGA